jgi:hypothetical protein
MVNQFKKGVHTYNLYILKQAPLTSYKTWIGILVKNRGDTETVLSYERPLSVNTPGLAAFPYRSHPSCISPASSQVLEPSMNLKKFIIVV